MPVLVGHLSVRRRTTGPDRGKPYLEIRAWCPWCRREHEVEVPGPMGLEAVIPTGLHCGAGHVALDPANRGMDRRTIEEAKAGQRRWAVERMLAEGRPVDRLAVAARIRPAV